MRVGIVCPYSWDVPGGVQFHVRDLAEVFLAQGHEVSVLAPADDDTPLPDYLVSCGRAVPVRYNGSVARLTFGPVTSARVTRWLESGRFDVVHLHEPVTPSVSLMALWAAEEPVVATFHTSTVRSRAMHAANPLLRPSLEKIRARIAVSEDAARTVRRHLGGDTYIIPNGVHVDRFDHAPTREEWTGGPAAPTLAFLGRVDEPRKGLHVALRALPAVLDVHPGARLLVAGPGDADEQLKHADPRAVAATVVLGAVSDADKAALLALGRRLRRPAPRRRELRHRPRRGDGGRRAGRRLRPHRVPRRPRRRAAPASPSRPARPPRWPGPSSTCWPTRPGPRRCAGWAASGRRRSTGRASRPR